MFQTFFLTKMYCNFFSGTNNLRHGGDPAKIFHFYKDIVRYANRIPNAYVILTGT